VYSYSVAEIVGAHGCQFGGDFRPPAFHRGSVFRQGGEVGELLWIALRVVEFDAAFGVFTILDEEPAVIAQHEPLARAGDAEGGFTHRSFWIIEDGDDVPALQAGGDFEPQSFAVVG